MQMNTLLGLFCQKEEFPSFKAVATPIPEIGPIQLGELKRPNFLNMW